MTKGTSTTSSAVLRSASRRITVPLGARQTALAGDLENRRRAVDNGEIEGVTGFHITNRRLFLDTDDGVSAYAL